MKNPIKLYAMLTCLGMAGCAYGRVGPVLTFEDVAKMKDPESISPHYRAWVNKVMKLRADAAKLIANVKKDGEAAKQTNMKKAKATVDSMALVLYEEKKDNITDSKTENALKILAKKFGLDESLATDASDLLKKAKPIVAAIKKNIPLTPEQRAQAEKVFKEASLIGYTLGVVDPTNKEAMEEVKRLRGISITIVPAVSEATKREFPLMIAPPPATLMITPPPAQSKRRKANVTPIRGWMDFEKTETTNTTPVQGWEGIQTEPTNTTPIPGWEGIQTEPTDTTSEALIVRPSTQLARRDTDVTPIQTKPTDTTPSTEVESEEDIIKL